MAKMVTLGWPSFFTERTNLLPGKTARKLDYLGEGYRTIGPLVVLIGQQIHFVCCIFYKQTRKGLTELFRQFKENNFYNWFKNDFETCFHSLSHMWRSCLCCLLPRNNNNRKYWCCSLSWYPYLRLWCGEKTLLHWQSWWCHHLGTCC